MCIVWDIAMVMKVITTSSTREIHPLDPQPHRHSMLVPTVCAPRFTRCSLGKYWSRDWFRGNFSLTQGLLNQQAANPGVHMLSMTHSGVRQRNLMTHAQCPLPVYYSQVQRKYYLKTIAGKKSKHDFLFV